MKEHATKCASRELPLLVAGGNPVYRPCDCDGYHTFDELYDHRVALYIALCNALRCVDMVAKAEGMTEGRFSVWRSKRHSDGQLCFGTGTMFVLGVDKEPGEQITYHIPIERWDDAFFAETLEKAPEFDGHTSDDVLERLKCL